ncbi:two-component system QseEF-associated lipoprotein QseG [Siccibacter turicensis]|uniref:Two-component system QseEF-associated lipoprotein QseG n=1 Tax=Siccibacter turicensis TaxID=357233 RepID=A0A2P8VIS1_9ENTR|nr:two-component system QseEF-associated lipoprotein QseG [Siccibacter turicensis]PSN07463.1 two-component system QseEF-associated lipoprotein QseG [Siccibacter turicensis]
MSLRVMNLLRPVLSRLLRPRALRTVLCASLAGALLSGCVAHPVKSSIKNKNEPQLPDHQLADFLSTDCLDIWQLGGHSTETNPLYWLRGMDCALRLTPAEARAQARRWSNTTWQDTFKRGILLANAKITPGERRRYVTALDDLSIGIPAQVRPLFQVWRDGQASLLQLSDERTRYSKLQQSTDGELDTLRQQQQHLRSQLDLTTRKLENLTDIERQLSSRKPASSYMQDNAHPAPDGSKATPPTDEVEKPDNSSATPAQEEPAQ